MEELARLLSHVYVYTPAVQLTISFDSKQHFKSIWSSAVRFLTYICKRSHFRRIVGQYADSNVNSGQRPLGAVDFLLLPAAPLEHSTGS